jgi:hypothetical protein
MDFALIVYIVFAIFVIGGGITYLSRMGLSVAAGLFGLGSLLVFVFYGMRWFQGDALKSNAVSASGTWPPTVNPCPDYWQKKVDSSGNIVCEDTKDYYSVTPNDTDANFALTGKSGSTPASLVVYNNSSSVKKSIPSERLSAILSGNTGLRWEGLFDGVSYTGRSPL